MAKKKKPLAPRCLRMKRGARLSSARRWLATQKNRTPVQIAKSYRERYRVDWPCAIHELALLGVSIDPGWVEQFLRYPLFKKPILFCDLCPTGDESLVFLRGSS